MNKMWVIDSWNSLGWKVSFNWHLLQPTCNEQGHLQPNQVAESLFHLTWNVSRALGIHTSLGNLFQCFTTLPCKKNIFLISNLIWPFFIVKLTLVILQQALLKVYLWHYNKSSSLTWNLSITWTQTQGFPQVFEFFQFLYAYFSIPGNQESLIIPLKCGLNNLLLSCFSWFNICCTVDNFVP